MFDIEHNHDGYTINGFSFYETADCSEITNIKELERLVADITEKYFDHKFDVYVQDDWHYGSTVSLDWNGDPLDGEDGDMPLDFMLDEVNQLVDNWFEVYQEALMFAQENSDFLEETA